MIHYFAPCELNGFGSWAPVGVIPEQAVAVSHYDETTERMEIAVPAEYIDEVPAEWEVV